MHSKPETFLFEEKFSIFKYGCLTIPLLTALCEQKSVRQNVLKLRNKITTISDFKKLFPTGSEDICVRIFRRIGVVEIRDDEVKVLDGVFYMFQAMPSFSSVIFLLCFPWYIFLHKPSDVPLYKKKKMTLLFARATSGWSNQSHTFAGLLDGLLILPLLSALRRSNAPFENRNIDNPDRKLVENILTFYDVDPTNLPCEYTMQSANRFTLYGVRIALHCDKELFACTKSRDSLLISMRSFIDFPCKTIANVLESRSSDIVRNTPHIIVIPCQVFSSSCIREMYTQLQVSKNRNSCSNSINIILLSNGEDNGVFRAQDLTGLPHQHIYVGNPFDPVEAVNSIRSKMKNQTYFATYISSFGHYLSANTDASVMKEIINEDAIARKYFELWNTHLRRQDCILSLSVGVSAEHANVQDHHILTECSSVLHRNIGLVSQYSLIMSAAHGGMFIREGSQNRDKSVAFASGIYVTLFYPRAYTISYAMNDDIPHLLNLEKECWDRAMRHSLQTITKRIKNKSQFTYVLKLCGKLCGVIYTQNVASPEKICDSTWLAEDDACTSEMNCLQLLRVNAKQSEETTQLPAGSILRNFALHVATSKGYKIACAVTRTTQYTKQHEGFKSYREYIAKTQKKVDGIVDRGLAFHTNAGAVVFRLLKAWRPEDTQNEGYGVLVTYDLTRERGISSESHSAKNIKYEGEDECRSHLLQILQQDVGLKCVDDSVPWFQMGLDSLHIQKVVSSIQMQFCIDVNASLLFDFPTLAKLTTEVFRRLSLRPAEKKSAKPEPIITPKTIFLFTGQGSQYAGMGRVLFENDPAFRKALQECDTILQKKRLIFKTNIIDLLYDGTQLSKTLINSTYSQIAIFCLEWALVAAWKQAGVTPDIVVGHSVGEIVAACVAGVFPLEDALTIVVERGRLMQSCPSANGAMYAVRCSPEKIMKSLDRNVCIACINGPQSIVLSGVEQSILRVIKLAKVSSKRLNVSHAFHSHLMHNARERFMTFLQSFKFCRTKLHICSTLTGSVENVGSTLFGPVHWSSQITEPVQYLKAIQSIHSLLCKSDTKSTISLIEVTFICFA